MIEPVAENSPLLRLPSAIAASYLRQSGGSAFRAFKFDLPRIENGIIAEITIFGLPAEL